MIQKQQLLRDKLVQLQEAIVAHADLQNTPGAKKMAALSYVQQLQQDAAHNKLSLVQPAVLLREAAIQSLKLLGVQEPDTPASMSDIAHAKTMLQSPVYDTFVRHEARQKADFELNLEQAEFFEYDEHFDLAEACQLKIDLPPSDVQGRAPKIVTIKEAKFSLVYPDKVGKLQLNKGAGLVSPGHLTALMGDFCGIPGMPIAKTGEETSTITAENKSRFLAAFKTLAKDITRDKIDMVEGVLATKFVEDETTNGVLQNLALILFKKDYRALLEDNFDHFAPWAEKAYLTGHTLAMEAALDANACYANNDYDGYQLNLQYAYQLDFAAAHFLTDNFSGGHVRVGKVREKLPETFGLFSKNPLIAFIKRWIFGDIDKAIANLWVHEMHDEDGRGVYANVNGKVILLEGDDHLHSPANGENKQAAIEALQTSVDEVYHVAKTGVMPEVSAVMKYIPQVISCDDAGNLKQAAPMFKYDAENDRVLQRYPLNDLNPKNVTYKPFGYFKAIKGLVELRVKGVHPEYQSTNMLNEKVEAKELQGQTLSTSTLTNVSEAQTTYGKLTAMKAFQPLELENEPESVSPTLAKSDQSVSNQACSLEVNIECEDLSGANVLCAPVA